MPFKRDDSGRRWVEMEFLVPGTPEQVWQAIATGSGMSAWFTTTKIEERVGGAISFDFGDDNCGEDISSGKVTVWDPPVRVEYEEYGWNGDAPPVATEVTVTARSGDRCVVRMVHSMVTDKDDWDGELESFETGWPGFFEILKVYLADFAGAQAATVRASAVSPEGEKQAWSTMTGALNIAAADVDDRCETPEGTPRMAGRVERIHQDAVSREVMLRIDQPAQGIAVVGACTVGDEGRAIVSIYLYGPDAADVAASEQPKWTSWLRGLLEGEAVTP
ncbi:SRPBCC family protein [Mycolicibacterium tusciae]|uniref:SRPBCC family protein n=1 Tax=Mycolicibacterium tusciae TaxID=75922 RepID=UPI00024A1307|nr:SRPBCC domain-containing protein [Mycolicibacterium tusciae]